MKALLFSLGITSALLLAGCNPDKPIYEQERKQMDRAKNVEKDLQQRDQQMRDKIDGEAKKEQ